MDGQPLYGKGPGESPVIGEVESDGAATAEETIWEVGLHLRGDSKGGGGFSDDGGVHFPKAEHGRAVH